MEEQWMLLIHEASSPWLDRVFLVSHWMGTVWFCTALVIVAAAISFARRNPREAYLWIVLGISTYLLQKGIKEIAMRPRPDLWDGPIRHVSYSFPSGHALAAATFYPLMARAAALRFPDRSMAFWVAGVSTAAFVGFGRLYLGVHWPTDVVAGWMLGAGQTWLGIRLTDGYRVRAADSAL